MVAKIGNLPPPQSLHGAQSAKPAPVRDQNELRSSLWNAVEFGERGGKIETWTNQDLRNFLQGKSSATPYEVLVLTRAEGRPDAPRFTSNQKYTMGDRVQVDLRYGNEPVESRKGIVWETNRDPDRTMFMLEGKDGAAPSYVWQPNDNPASWDPSSVHVQVTASALSTPSDAKRAEEFCKSWNTATTEARLDRLRRGDGFDR